MNVTRRNFLQSMGALSLAQVGAWALPAGEAPMPSRLKTSLNAYSFYVELNRGMKNPEDPKGLTLKKLLNFTAAEGFEGIDLTGYFFSTYPQVPTDAVIFAVKDQAFKLGLSISGSGVKNDFTTADAAIRAEGVKRIKEWVGVCVKLGAPVLRVFADTNLPDKKTWKLAAPGATREQVETWMADDLRACSEFAAQAGVYIGVQNHGDFLTSGAEHLSLLQRVNHPYCKAIVDTGKYLTEDPYVDMALVAPLAVNWQVKETPFGKPNKPLTDMKRVVKIAREAGYRGFLPIESLPMGRADYDTPGELRRMLKELKQAIAAN